MTRLSKRVTELEHSSGGGAVHCIPIYDDKTDAESVALYEAKNGPIVDGPNVLLVFIRKYPSLAECAI